MTTLNELRQRLEDNYLEPATEETPTVSFTADIDATTTTFTIVDGILSPDEESYIGPGQLLEIDNEVIRVTSYDTSTKVVTCRRGVRYTEAMSHASSTSEIRFPTRWLRKTQIDALRSAIAALWRPLFAEKEIIATVSASSYISLPLTTVRATVRFDHADGTWPTVSSRLIPNHPTEPGRAAVFVSASFPYQSALCVIEYGVRIEAPADDNATIVNLPEKWERIVVVDAAAELLSGVDIDAVTQENMTETLRLDRFPVKSGYSISQNLIRYREYLVDLAKSELVARRPKQIRRRRVDFWE